MKHLRHFLAVGASAVALAPAVSAQAATIVRPVQAQSYMTGSALGVQIQQPATPTRLNIRDTGTVQPASPDPIQEWSGTEGADSPNYTPAALFGHWAPQVIGGTNWSPATIGHTPELGGFSTGGDVTPAINVNGELQTGDPSGPSWYYLSFSVKDQVGFNYGEPESYAPGLIGLIQSEEETAEGSVFGYAADDSQIIPAEYVDTIRVDYTRSQFNPAGSGTDWDLTALDWGAGLISRTPNGTNTSLFPERKYFYFTLSSAWLPSGTPSITPPNSTTSMALDCRTIYVMCWEWDLVGGQGYAWSFPKVAWTETDLFGDSEPNAEIDALSIYIGDNAYTNPERVVFSLVQGASLSSTDLNDPFLVAQHGNTNNGTVDINAVSLKTDRGDKFSAKTQIDPSTGPDAHGFCGIDPDDLTEFDEYVGWPTDDSAVAPGNAQIGLSVWREEYDALDVPAHALHLEAHGGKEHGVVVGVVEFQIAVALVNAPKPAPTSIFVDYEVGVDDVTSLDFVIDDSLLSPGVNFTVSARAILHGFKLGSSGLEPILPVDSWECSLKHRAQ